MKNTVAIILLVTSRFTLAGPVSEEEHIHGQALMPAKNICGKPAKKIILPPSEEGGRSRSVHGTHPGNWV